MTRAEKKNVRRYLYQYRCPGSIGLKDTVEICYRWRRQPCKLCWIIAISRLSKQKREAMYKEIKEFLDERARRSRERLGLT